MITTPQYSRQHRGFSLIEMILVIAIIGVIAAVAIPNVSKAFQSSNDAKDRANARNLESMSATLAAMGVAHVIPESLGGVEATARLIRTGVFASEGPMAGSQFKMAALSDEDISSMSKYLRVIYDKYELRLEFYDTEGGITYDYRSKRNINYARIEVARIEHISIS